MTQNSKKSSKTAVGGVITALSIVLMFLTSVIPTLTYALPAAAGFLITLIVIEIDKKWALGVYVAVSLLSVLLIADKEAAVILQIVHIRSLTAEHITEIRNSQMSERR